MSAPFPRIAVVGKGVSGLTTGLRLLEAGYPVDLYFDPQGHTTSRYAGAYWWPHKVGPAARVGPWAALSFQVYAALAEDPATGVGWTDHLRLCREPDPTAYALECLPPGAHGASQARDTHLSGYRAIDEREVRALGFPVAFETGCRVRVPRIEVATFLGWLENRVQRAGGRLIPRRLADLDGLFRDHDLVVHCAGLGATELVGDEAVHPIRGQSVRVTPPPDLHHSLRVVEGGEVFTLILPHGESCVLGGTDLVGEGSLEPDPAITERLLERCREAAPQLAAASWLESTVGLRPGRPEVCLEVAEIAPRRPVVHNYGHGGGGFTVAWGCAAEVVAGVREAVP